MVTLKDQVVLITGASSGFGAAAAKLFAKEGCKVVLAARRIERLNEMTKELRAAGESAFSVAVDVTQPEQINEMVKSAVNHYGRIDILFNNAGFGAMDWFEELEPERHIQTLINVNLTGTMLVTRAVLPDMLDRGSGHIINMASVASSLRGLPNRFAYGATKAAVIGLTKAIAADYVRQGIRCNAVCPGTVDTPSLQGRINAQPNPEQARQDFIARQPMGRLGSVDDITGLLVFLASDESLFATGNAYSIDGGMTI